MKKLWRNRPILIALLAAALFLVLAALTVGRRSASRAEDMFSGAVLPVQEAVSDITDRVTDFFTRVFFPSSIQQENQRLTKLVSAYERRLILYEAMEQENARLAELLDYASANSNKFSVTAPMSSRHRWFTCTTGSPSGLSAGGRATVVSAQITTIAAACSNLGILKLPSNISPIRLLSVMTTKLQGRQSLPEGAAIAARSRFSITSEAIVSEVYERTLLRCKMLESTVS